MTAGRWLARRAATLRGEGRGWVLLTVAAGWFVTLGVRFVVPALLPRIKETIGIGNAAAGLAVTVIWLTYAGMQLPAGALVDRVGERWILTVSLSLAGLSLLAFVLPTYLLFLLAAALFGLGTGLFGPSRGTVLSRTFRENDGAAFGATLAAGSIGAAALPFVATWLSGWADGRIAGLAGWQVALVVFTPVFALLAVGAWWAVPPRGERGTAGDHEGADVATDGKGDAAGGDGGADETGSRRRALRAVVGAATERRVLIAAVGSMFMLFTFQGLTAFYTTYLVEQKGLAEATAGGLFALLFLAGAGFQSIAGRAADRYGHRAVLMAIVVLSAPPLALLPFAEGTLALAALTVPIGIRLASGPVANAYMVAELPDAVRGTAWGLVRTVFFVVGSLGSVAVGVVADAGLFDVAVFGLAAVTLPALAIFAVLPARAPRTAQAK